jgi:hypothetical protein
VTCADADSGKPIWSVRRPGGILSSLLITQGKVIGIEAPSKAFAVDAADGHPAWTRSLSGPSFRQPLEALGGVMVRLDDRVLLLRATDGAEEASWHWPKYLTGHVAAGESLAFAVRCGREDSIVLGRHSVVPRGCRILRLSQNGSFQWDVESAIRGPKLVWDERSRFLYEACGGLGIVDPESGQRKHLVWLAGTEILLTPAVDRETVYVTTVEGEVIRLRSPLSPGV